MIDCKCIARMFELCAKKKFILAIKFIYLTAKYRNFTHKK